MMLVLVVVAAMMTCSNLLLNIDHAIELYNSYQWSFCLFICHCFDETLFLILFEDCAFLFQLMLCTPGSMGQTHSSYCSFTRSNLAWRSSSILPGDFFKEEKYIHLRREYNCVHFNDCTSLQFH